MRWSTLLIVPALALTISPPAADAHPRPTDLDVLFVGAHPDDEAGLLAALGQWGADRQVRSGVVTVTRGEGGGNAVGPEEGPALGRIREAEERRAVGKAGISEVINLDKADFYYTVSSPLTEQAWGATDSLGKLVRVIRQTRPELILTMNPAPSPGNHGNHQYAARLAIEAYHAAADPKAFREQGLRPWSVSRLFGGGLRGQGSVGPNCVADFTPTEPTDRVWGVWSGRRAPNGETWAQVERSAQREYASQGWAGFPDVPTDPNRLGCDYLNQLASRVPYRLSTRGADGPLEGALLPGALPLGTTLQASATRYAMTPGSATTVRVTASPGKVALAAPPGWTVSGSGKEFTVTAPANASTGKVRLPVTLTRGGRTGTTEVLVEVVAPVVAAQAALPQVAQFAEWATKVGHPELAGLVAPVLTLPSGGSREIGVTVRNFGATAQSGTVELTLPAGFASGPAQRFTGLAPDAAVTLPFAVTNTDPSQPTGMQGGDYRYTITVTPDSGAVSKATPALELVPATTIPAAGASPTVDGVAGPGEYPGPELNLTPRWEGDECASAADCSATARLAWHGDTLQALVTVTDDVLGTKLAATDCKRHWRTDSVELTIDPRGRSENTSSTYKLAALPATEDGPPCVLRDADNHQGDAPGVRVAAVVSSPGYTIEVAIPLAEVPGAVDPAGMGLNLLVYDSDTQDKTGQTRIGWSTWGGVQGDPYRWGRAVLPGYTPPPNRPTDPPPPVLPLEVLTSVDSPQSIEQAVRTGIALGGAPAARPVRIVRDNLITAEAGTAHVFAVDASGTVLDRKVIEVRPGTTQLPVTGERILVGFTNSRGGTAAAAR